jgi:DNA-directed RNA polymerase subunit RPC12/RpoP
MEEIKKELGLNCPDCANHITTPLDQVLFSDQLICTTCSLQFSPDKNSAEQLWKQVQQNNFTF